MYFLKKRVYVEKCCTDEVTHGRLGVLFHQNSLPCAYIRPPTDIWTHWSLKEGNATNEEYGQQPLSPFMNLYVCWTVSSCLLCVGVQVLSGAAIFTGVA